MATDDTVIREEDIVEEEIESIKNWKQFIGEIRSQIKKNREKKIEINIK